MDDLEDSWPMPDYNPGPKKHLHAVGVLSACYNSFEDSLFRLYQHHPMMLKLPTELTHLYYTRLSEKERGTAINITFKSYEKEETVREVVWSIVSYFDWCHSVRNTLLHAEPYPPSIFGSQNEQLHISKKKSKQSQETGYLSLDLPTLRTIADLVRQGAKTTSATILFLRYRDIPRKELPLSLRALDPEPLPQKLDRPPDLILDDRPSDVPDHIYERLSPFLKM